MNWRLIKAIVLLPGMVLVFIPIAILLVTGTTPLKPEFQYPMEVTFLVAIALIASGIYLAIKSTKLFIQTGEGTPAPWDPPKKLVVQGLYRYIRNPMICGALMILTGEAVLFNSWPLLLWAAIFMAAKNVYFKRVEEKELTRRFGTPYQEYKRQVPRWIPRLESWE
jgi:protein-S-isoprenylcysteine O-methyltransferase Ste14